MFLKHTGQPFKKMRNVKMDFRWVTKGQFRFPLQWSSHALQNFMDSLFFDISHCFEWTFCGVLEVPSGFYLSDCFLWLDALLGKGLLVPDAQHSKQSLAAQDAKRLKKLMGALRYLFRNSYWVMKQWWHKFSSFFPLRHFKHVHWCLVSFLSQAVGAHLHELHPHDMALQVF